MEGVMENISALQNWISSFTVWKHKSSKANIS